MESLELNAITQTIAMQAVDKWMKYVHNFNSCKFFIDDEDYVWSPCCMEAFPNWNHFHQKWIVKAENIGGSNALIWLWHELDAENKQRLINWLLENYEQ